MRNSTREQGMQSDSGEFINGFRGNQFIKNNTHRCKPPRGARGNLNPSVIAGIGKGFGKGEGIKI